MTSIQHVGVLGSGTMGAGIAQAAAQHGYRATLYDIAPEFLDKARGRIEETLAKGVEKGKVSPEEKDTALRHLSVSTQLADLAACDLIIEAVPEDLELKKKLFAELDGLCKAETILASNTSSLSITALGGATGRPEKVAGLHFFNPVALMKLVEVIQGQRTSNETVQTLLAFSQSLGKTPVTAKDTPGFIVNRVARPFYGEAFRILGEQGGGNEAVVKIIDTVMRQAGNFRMGPFELMDLIGIDVNFAVTQSVYNAYFQNHRYLPHPIQQKMVEAGLLGRKTGEGFYKYEQ